MSMNGFERRSSGLYAHVERLAARDCGVTTGEVTGYTAEQVSLALYRLRLKGRVFAAKLSYRSVRYFADEARAKAFEAANRRAQVGASASNHAGRHLNLGGTRHQRAWWDADAPMVITERTKVTIAPPPPEQPRRTNTHSEWGG